MTPRVELVGGRYVHVTPAGAWRAVQRRQVEPEAAMVRTFLAQETTPELERRTLAGLCELDDQAAVEILWRAQERGWIEGLDVPRTVRHEPLETLLPVLLAPLASSGRVLLADQQGFCLSTTGFERQRSTDLSAISAGIASLQERHESQIGDIGEGVSGAWALVDEVGNSRIGFWPLHIGGQRFVLVAADLPYLHDPHLAELIWVLSTRYGTNVRADTTQLRTGT